MVASFLPYCRSLAESAQPTDRLLWLRIATDVISRTARPEVLLGPEWESQFDANLDLADEETRLEVARRLSVSGRTLTRLAGSFLKRPDAAAQWTLEHALHLPELALAQALPSVTLASAVARRPDLSPALVDQLLADGAVATLVELAGNVRVRLERAQLAALVLRAATHARLSGDRRLARALLRRSPLTVEFAPLFLDASSAQRSQILLAAERATFGAENGRALTPLSTAAVSALERHGLEGEEGLLAEDLMDALGCDPDIASRIVADPSGEPLAVTLAALGAPNDVCVRLLTARDMAEGPDYPRLGALARLQGALSPVAASAVVRAFLGQDGSPAMHSATAPRRPTPPLQARASDAARASRKDRAEREKRAGDVG